MILKINVEIVENKIDKNQDIMAKVYYPDEGNKIVIEKGLSIIEVKDSIFHEVGHLIDWYLSKGKQSKNVKVREKIADKIEYKLNVYEQEYKRRLRKGEKNEKNF